MGSAPQDNRPASPQREKMGFGRVGARKITVGSARNSHLFSPLTPQRPISYLFQIIGRYTGTSPVKQEIYSRTCNSKQRRKLTLYPVCG